MSKRQSAFQTFNQAAQAYQDKFMDLSLYHDSFDQFCSLITTPNARVLDIGCGPGNISRYLLAKRPDFLLEGVDLAPNMIELARQNNTGAHFSVMDCRHIGQLPGTYHAVMCGFCMPYLSKTDCQKLIRDSAALLEPGGIVYFSTMEGDYKQSGYRSSSDGKYKTYTYFHEAESLRRMMERAGFELQAFKRQAYPGAGEPQVYDLIFIGRKT